MKQPCVFCQNLELSLSGIENNPWDRILMETKNFAVLVTVGAIVEGWLLLVPKKHYLCMGELSGTLHSELQELKSVVSEMLTDCYGPIALFEHGPAKPKQLVGCGVDHAHLHFVPTQCNLLEGASKMFKNFQWRKISSVKETINLFNSGQPYLYVEQPVGKAIIATDNDIPSQLFQKVLASYVGQPDNYNWREHSYEDKVKSTVTTLEKWLTRNGKQHLLAVSCL